MFCQRYQFNLIHNMKTEDADIQHEREREREREYIWGHTLVQLLISWLYLSKRGYEYFLSPKTTISTIMPEICA